MRRNPSGAFFLNASNNSYAKLRVSWCVCDSMREANSIKKVDVVGVGLNAIDTQVLVPHYPAQGSKVDAQSVTLLPGGQVATAMIACQRWGMTARYVGKLGDDAAGEIHRKEFESCGVETQVRAIAGCASHRSFIIVAPDGERTVVCHHDEQVALNPIDLKREWIVNARALLVDGYDTAAAITAAEWAREAGIPVIADFDEAYPQIEELMKVVDYAIVSRDFPQQICHEHDLSKSLPKLHGRFGSKLTAATLGTDGVLAWDGKEFHHARAFIVPAVDSTGAGDIFHAGFIYALLKDWPLARQLDFACAAAALNCTAQGARGGIRPVSEIENLVETGPRYPAAER